MLDLWQNEHANRLAPAANEGTQLPATFGESFDAAWSQGEMFSQSLAGNNARLSALDDYLHEIKDKTGQDIALDYGEGAPSANLLWMQANDAVRGLKEKNPSLDLSPLSDDEIEQRAVAKSRAAIEGARDMQAREHSGLGFLTGELASTAADPINLAALPLAPEGGIGILASALRWGAIAGASQAAIETVGMPYRLDVQPDYLTSGAPIANVAETVAGGAVLGGTVKTLGNLWTRVKTGQWPQSVRDAGNVVESEANIQQSNMMAGANGEALHRTALQSAIESIVDGRPIEVDDIVSGSLLRDYEKKLAPVMDALSDIHIRRNAVTMEQARAEAQAQPPLPFEQSAKQQELAGAIDGFGGMLQSLAREAGFVLDAPEARQLAERIAGMPQDEALKALDEFMLRPQTLRDTLPPPSPARPGRELSPQPVLHSAEQVKQMLTSPDHAEAVRADIDRARMTGDVKLPVGKDENGDPIYRSLDSAIKGDVDSVNELAEQIQACAAPAAPEPEKE